MRSIAPGKLSDRGGENGLDTLETEEIRRAIGEPSFSRGQSYYRLGAVRTVEFVPPDWVRARVQGTASEPYGVSATLVFGPGGTLRSVKGDCACPMKFNCKHVAAALLAAADPSTPRFGDPEGAGAEPTDREIRLWLGRRPEGRTEPAGGPPPGPAKPGREHLFYVIGPDWLRGMGITPYRAYLRQDGTVGTNFREFSDRRSTWARRNLTFNDAALLGQLEFFGDGGYGPGGDWPEGQELIDLIRLIVETGRALEGSIHGRALSWSAPRRCELRWEVYEGGEQRAVARDGAGSALTLLAFSTPIYVDPQTGETGVAETGLEPGMAAWLAQAPAVPPGAVESVASALSGIAGHGPVPHPKRVEERTGVRPEPELTLYGCERTPRRHGYGAYGVHFVPPTPAVYPCARLEIAYEGAAERVRPGKGGELLAAGGNPPAIIARSRARESALRRKLVRAGERHGGREPYGLGFHTAPPGGLLEADVVLPAFKEGDEAAAGRRNLASRPGWTP